DLPMWYLRGSKCYPGAALRQTTHHRIQPALHGQQLELILYSVRRGMLPISLRLSRSFLDPRRRYAQRLSRFAGLAKSCLDI
ncbi:hypothetical protein IscW_ISCW012185, partial [Ixodes scapularis]